MFTIRATGGALVHLLCRLRRQLCAEVPVERGRGSALLHVAQYVLADAEEVPALLREHLVDEVRGVLGVGLLVADDQAAVDFAKLHLIFQHFLLDECGKLSQRVFSSLKKRFYLASLSNSYYLQSCYYSTVNRVTLTVGNNKAKLTKSFMMSPTENFASWM